MYKVNYTDNYDSKLFIVTKVNNCRSGRRLSQKAFLDENNAIYNTVNKDKTSTTKLIAFHYDLKDTVDLMLFFEKEEASLITENSINSKTANGKPDKWTLTKEDNLYRLVVKRGGKSSFDVDLLMNEHTKECIHDALWEAFIEYNCNLKLESAKSKISNTFTETIPESRKEEKQEEIKQEEETLATLQKNDNDNGIKSLYDTDQVINTILEAEGLTKENMSKPENKRKVLDVYFCLFPSQRDYFENRYKISCPSDMFPVLQDFFKEGGIDG